MTPTRFDELIGVLCRGGVDFTLVGGLAGIVHGASRVTFDMGYISRREFLCQSGGGQSRVGVDLRAACSGGCCEGV
jgi:hypothetical protein